ncbi:hypothetical protein FQA39_LY06295, partial [Lamprigera yunnana]
MLRRPFDQLVAQGIMPPHKTPAAFHGQRRQLERAKTGDILKAKIQQRPSRQELERRHILDEDPGHVDPSLAERQRMLKKARLADQLNDQLSHRPGPLELIQKNILHTEEPIENAVKSGRIPYKATCEGQLNRPQHPQSYVCLEDDSQSSEATKCDAPGKDKNRKKSKSKSTPKTRTIKFHEYKGPPSAQKNSTTNLNAAGESSYDLLLQQQTLLLQFQLQLQHKYPQIILPASQKNGSRLEDMKVSDLKAELKRRSLPVSGSKPQLIERLKPFTDDIVREQQRQIEELQRELTISQLK